MRNSICSQVSCSRVGLHQEPCYHSLRCLHQTLISKQPIDGDHPICLDPTVPHRLEKGQICVVGVPAVELCHPLRALALGFSLDPYGSFYRWGGASR